MVGTVLLHRSESAANAAAIPLASGDEGGLVSEAAGTAPGELIEPGRALALADFAPPSVGAGERLIRLAYRFGISGSALAAPFRRQGYGFEALGHLLAQAAGRFGRTEARALSAADNVASQALLSKCGFTLLEARPATPRRPAEQLWQRRLV